MITFGERFFLFFILFIGYFHLHGQSKIDSLQTLLEHSTQDSTLANIYFQLGLEYRNTQPDSSIFYYEQSIVHSDKAQRIDIKAETLRNLSTIYIIRKSFDTATKYLKEAARFEEQLKNTSGLSKCYNNLGILSFQTGLLDSARFYYKKVFQIEKEKDNKIGMARYYTNMGALNQYEGNTDSSLFYYEKGLIVAVEVTDNQMIAKGYNNLGSIYSLRGNPVRAISNYRKALEYYEKATDLNGLSNCYRNLGVQYLTLSEYLQALEYIQKAIKIYQQISSQAGIANCNEIMGSIHVEMENYEKAHRYYSESLKTNRQINNFEGLYSIYTRLGELALKEKRYKKALEAFGEAEKNAKTIGYHLIITANLMDFGNAYSEMGNYEKSIRYLEKCLKKALECQYTELTIKCYNNLAKAQIELSKNRNMNSVLLHQGIKNSTKAMVFAKQTRNAEQIALAQKNLSEAYELLTDYQASLSHYKDYTTTKDSILNIEKHKSISELETKYQTEQKEHEIARLNQQNLETELALKSEKLKKSQAFILLILILFFASGFILFLIFKAKRKKLEGEKREQQLLEQAKNDIDLVKQEKNREKLKALDTELKQVSQEIHDGILSDLTGIQFLLKGSEPKNQNIEKATGYLTVSAEKLRKISHRLNTPEFEYNTLEAVIDSYLDQYKQSGLSIDFRCSLKEDIDNLKQVTIYRIIQEAINNTLKHSDANRSHISLTTNENVIELQIKDNGQSLKSTKAGIGLLNIHDRVKSLNGKIKTTKSNGFELFIELPLVS